MVTVRTALKDLRSELKLSQEGLARKLNLTLRTVSRYENDTPPTGRMLTTLAKMADEAGRSDIAVIFRDALYKEVGYEGMGPIQIMPDEEEDFRWAPGMYAAPVNAACCLTRLRYGCDEGQRVYICPQCDGKPDIEIGFLAMFDPELAKDRKARGWRAV